jgi:opacity protein-like surface antigen
MKSMFLAAVLAAVASAPASAATLYVGHGIPGKVFGDPSNKLPVDVCLVAADGAKSPLLTALNFNEFKEIGPLDAGRYDVEVQLSDAGSCKGTAAAAASIFLGIGENATAIAHLTEQATPTITKFVNDFRPLAAGQARVYARHAASVGDVDVRLKGQGWPISIRGLENPDQEGADLRAGSTYVSISQSSNWWGWGERGNHHGQTLFAARLDLVAGTAYFAYAVGIPNPDKEKSTFTVLLQALKLN